MISQWHQCSGSAFTHCLGHWGQRLWGSCLTWSPISTRTRELTDEKEVGNKTRAVYVSSDLSSLNFWWINHRMVFSPSLQRFSFLRECSQICSVGCFGVLCGKAWCLSTQQMVILAACRLILRSRSLERAPSVRIQDSRQLLENRAVRDYK